MWLHRHAPRFVRGLLVGGFHFDRTSSTVHGPDIDGSIVVSSPEMDITVHPFTPSSAEEMLRRRAWLPADRS